MPSHTARSLFDKNINSAQDCLALFDAVDRLQPKGVNINWVLRAAVVFTVSALDTYFHDKIKFRIGKISLDNPPPALAKFEITVGALPAWDKAQRKRNVLRNWVAEYLSSRPLQSPNSIADALKLIGIQSFWDTIEPNGTRRDQVKKEFSLLVRRRNQISHEGDRQTSRRSAKKLRPIDRKNVKVWIDFAIQLVAKVESAFPG